MSTIRIKQKPEASLLPRSRHVPNTVHPLNTVHLPLNVYLQITVHPQIPSYDEALRDNLHNSDPMIEFRAI